MFADSLSALKSICPKIWVWFPWTLPTPLKTYAPKSSHVGFYCFRTTLTYHINMLRDYYTGKKNQLRHTSPFSARPSSCVPRITKCNVRVIINYHRTNNDCQPNGTLWQLCHLNGPYRWVLFVNLNIKLNLASNMRSNLQGLVCNGGWHSQRSRKIAKPH